MSLGTNPPLLIETSVIGFMAHLDHFNWSYLQRPYFQIRPCPLVPGSSIPWPAGQQSISQTLRGPRLGSSPFTTSPFYSLHPSLFHLSKWCLHPPGWSGLSLWNHPWLLSLDIQFSKTSCWFYFQNIFRIWLLNASTATQSSCSANLLSSYLTGSEEYLSILLIDYISLTF